MAAANNERIIIEQRNTINFCHMSPMLASTNSWHCSNRQFVVKYKLLNPIYKMAF